MKKRYFIFIILILIISLFTYLAFSFKLIPNRKYYNKDFNIETYYSKNDQDHDGIDDQSDILNNAKAYVKTKPQYKSKYYKSGYPDDQYGVCTDVVGYALKHSGYDLMKLVDQDISKHLDIYHLKKNDKKIDFRRVKNLRIYFERHAKSLTTDIHKIDQWQGGDIVVFKKHIGIISDARNKDGIPYIIHHGYVGQIFYEEEYLEKDPPVGHYRI